MTIKEAVRLVRREIGKATTTRLVDHARLAGDTLVVVTEHRSDVERSSVGSSVLITTRVTVFSEGSPKAGLIVASRFE